ncbi:NAD(P)H-hydrate dehydratase [Methylomonas rivi]|uniref:Bifunctional NAD(P)H-hydrate repair enzyme n=1 Tax=Methylomonas rivi TaxID=2952226 RepID=A0ABT1U5Y2_9GAMM|nr:NAD(P)H-hydrate dehydratase [Methylomonas sp. WSC-6]MCQ8129271.1 NAD(P)H-hydrate dehydratase [Methylomonas sp. WSC-6]
MQTSSQALYRVAQIREAEHIAIQNLQMPGLQLMRSAGMAAFNALRQRWPEQSRITVFCGAGNNAGDGYVLAKLALAAGFGVSVYTLVPVGQLGGDALTVYQDFIQAGGRVSAFDARAQTAGIIVDALLGTGLSRPVGEEYAHAISHINRADCPVLSIDVPSGLHADTGCVLGCAVKADLTVTFIALKCGLFTGEAGDYCGDIVCSSLNVPDAVLAQLPATAHLSSKPVLKPRPRSAHKGHFGHVLLIGGNRGFSGAIRLAGEAALFGGAGLVSIASRAGHADLLNIGRPELMCHAAETACDLHPLLERASVIVIGPGLGQDSWAQDMLRHALASEKPCVADADALNLLARHPVRRPNWVLTPHPGEAARLLGCNTHDIAADRFAAVKKLQNQYAGVCVLKGAGSLIADGGNLLVNTTGNPGMASGGMGDVLAGVTGALLAQGLTLTDAAKLAVHVHGEAADGMAATQGERGMLAGDLLPKIRELLN